MNLEELQAARDRERQTDKLQQLRESFYADAGEFIQQLQTERDRAAERADDPFDSPEVSQLTDEINTAEQTVEAIYEKRVGKIVKAASFAAADLPAESDGMTVEEEKLFDTLVEDIKANRQHVLDVLAGEASPDENDRAETEESPPEPAEAGGATSADPTPETESEPEPSGDYAPPDVVGDDGVEEVSAADVMGAGPEKPGGEAADADDGTADDSSGPAPASEQDGRSPPDIGHDSSGESRTPPEAVAGEGAAGPETGPEGGGDRSGEPEVRNDGGTAEKGAGVERETVRITADVGAIFGVDEREYDLSTDDVVTLPAANAGPLVERDAAERLD